MADLVGQLRGEFVGRGSLWAILLFAAFGMVVACSSGSSGDAPSAESVSVVLGNETAYVGDATALGGAVTIPPGAFPEGTEVTVLPLTDPPLMTEDGVDPLGPGAIFEVSSLNSGSDEAMQIVLSFDPALVTNAEEVVVGYYHSQTGWIFLPADEVDLATGTVTVTTYHFSLFRPFRTTPTQRHDQRAARLAAEDYVRSDAVGQSEEQIQHAVAAILRDGVGLADNRVIEIIAQSVIAQAPGGKIANALYNLDADAFQSAMLEETLSVLGEMATVEGSPVREALGKVGLVGSVAGALAEGDAVGVARLLGEEIVSNLPVISKLKDLGDTAAELTNHVINDLWLDPQIQVAYEAYRDGANQRRGYSVAPRNWDDLVQQIPAAVERQIRIRHRDAFCRVHDCSSLSTDEYNAIGDQALEDLRVRFEQRAEREPEVARLTEVYKELYNSLQSRRVLPIASNEITRMDPAGVMSHGAMLDEIDRLINILRRQVGRGNIVSMDDWYSASESDKKNMIPVDAVTQAIDAWYSDPRENRQQAYEQILISWGLLEADGEEPYSVRIEGDGVREYTIAPDQTELTVALVASPVPPGGVYTFHYYRFVWDFDDGTSLRVDDHKTPGEQSSPDYTYGTPLSEEEFVFRPKVYLLPSANESDTPLASDSVTIRITREEETEEEGAATEGEDEQADAWLGEWFHSALPGDWTVSTNIRREWGASVRGEHSQGTPAEDCVRPPTISGNLAVRLERHVQEKDSAEIEADLANAVTAGNWYLEPGDMQPFTLGPFTGYAMSSEVEYRRGGWSSVAGYRDARALVSGAISVTYQNSEDPIFGDRNARRIFARYWVAIGACWNNSNEVSAIETAHMLDTQAKSIIANLMLADEKQE